MTHKVKQGTAGLALAAVLYVTGTAAAGPLAEFLGLGGHDCPPPQYPPIRYWAPALARLEDKHGPKLCVYAPDRHPEIPPDCTILTYPCPPVAPTDTFIPVPAAPAESKFHY